MAVTTLTVWDLWTDPVGVAALLDVWGGEAGRAPSGGLRYCACSRTGWGRHHHTTRNGSTIGPDTVVLCYPLNVCFS